MVANYATIISLPLVRRNRLLYKNIIDKGYVLSESGSALIMLQPASKTFPVKQDPTLGRDH